MGSLRFVVGEPGIRQSSSWKLWSQGDDVYLLTRGPISKAVKFSFHKSGKCRWAEIAERRDGSDRCIKKWERDPVPSAGTGGGCRLVSIAFPANHLSAPSPLDGGKPHHWINVAPPGMATVVEVILTAEDKGTASGLLAGGGERRLIYHAPLRSGLNVLVTSAVFACGPVEITMPGEPRKPGQVFGDLVFPDEDVLGTGRPVRLSMIGEEVPPTVWELGGYQVHGSAAHRQARAVR